MFASPCEPGRRERGGEALTNNPPWIGHCQFARAAPRHFLYPALLLLLAEEPRHGYRLVDALLRLGFGPFDRPSVYRALADLEADGLLRSWSASSTAGSMRHVYALTEHGFGALATWMDVVEDEQSLLCAVLKRYDAVLGKQSDIDSEDDQVDQAD